MGNTLLGNTDEMYLYANPSALVFSNKEMSVDLSGELYPKELAGREQQYNLSAGYKLGYHQALFLGARYKSGLDIAGIKPNEWTADFGYAFEITKSLVAYATGTYFETSVGEKKAKGMAFSVGLGYQRKINKNLLTLGLRIQDFGKPFRYNAQGLSFPMPVSLGFGGDYCFALGKEHELTYALSTRYFMPKDAEMLQLNTGTEYCFKKMLSARLGYQYAQREGSRLTMGLGCQFSGFKLNSSYQKTFSVTGIDLFMFGIGFSL